MIRRPPRSTLDRSSAASDVYKRQVVCLHQPGAPPDFAMSGVDPQPPPKPSGRIAHLEIAKKLLEKGADPNGLVEMKEGRFAPGGGLARQPPSVQIGRHYLAYTGATPVSYTHL